jgi:hypothetical protein
MFGGKKLACLYLALVTFCVPAFANTTLTLDSPGGAISGLPGAIVGWGFTLTNTTNFLVVTSSDFCVGPIASPCVNALGTYSDFIGPNFLVVGESPEAASVSQSLNLATLTGVGSFQLNAGVTPGQSEIGKIVLTYDLYNVDPNDPTFNPVPDTISVGNLITTDASVSVAGSATVPEPASIFLVGIGLFALRQGVRRRPHHRPSCAQLIARESRAG